MAAQFNGHSELISEQTHEEWPLRCHTLQLIALPNRAVSVSVHLLWNSFNLNKWFRRQEPSILPSSFSRCSPEPDFCPLPLSSPTKEPEQSQSLHSHSSSVHWIYRQVCPPKSGVGLWVRPRDVWRGTPAPRALPWGSKWQKLRPVIQDKTKITGNIQNRLCMYFRGLALFSVLPSPLHAREKGMHTTESSFASHLHA